MKRCINIDWLEVHALEPIDSPRDANYFRALGLSVSERPYGTRVYDQMFTILTHADEPFIEIRRSPVGAKNPNAIQVVDINSCHIRLHNRTCYYKGAAKIMSDFLHEHGYTFRRISRIDICLDFERFDSGDKPQDFLQRYLAGKYSKINQANISAHGSDLWDGRHWNSVSWGAPKSMIGTKFYNKTLELKQKKDKPYIRQAWASAGLVQDFVHLTKVNSRGVIYSPDIWRLEFSISSSVRSWFVMQTFLGEKNKYHSVRNDLDCYFTDDQLMQVFASLVDHYFHFKKPQKDSHGKDLRKDRCPDKQLFNFTEQNTYYKVEKVATARPTDSSLQALAKRLRNYRAVHFERHITKACDILLHDIEERMLKGAATIPWNQDEITLLQRLVSERIRSNSTSTFEHDLFELQALLQIVNENSDPQTKLF